MCCTLPAVCIFRVTFEFILLAFFFCILQGKITAYPLFLIFTVPRDSKQESSMSLTVKQWGKGFSGHFPLQLEEIMLSERPLRASISYLPALISPFHKSRACCSFHGHLSNITSTTSHLPATDYARCMVLMNYNPFITLSDALASQTPSLFNNSSNTISAFK